MVAVGIIGASGYTGAELLRICASHPDLEVRFATGDSQAGSPVAALYPGLAAAYPELVFQPWDPALLTAALTQFYEIRETPGLKKRPSTSEVLDWLKLLLAEDLAPEDLRRETKTALPKLYGALLKTEQDIQLFERLAFMARAGR